MVRVVWESLDYVCAERLAPALLPTAQQLPRRKPSPPNRLLREIPMGRLPWDIELPGSFETDLVHHCGEVASGEYIYTLQLIDIATGWSERVAILGRSQAAMVKGFKRVRERLPFPIRHLHPDNGSEFFNDHLIRYFGEEVTGLSLSRSRPYRKNDNRFVEQKNSTLVRAYVGYERLDNGAQCAALNELYDKLWLYYNLFQPVMHMVAKEITRGKICRKHDQARTPYQRLLATNVISLEQKASLAELYTRTNPRQLRRTIYDTIEHLNGRNEKFTLNERREEALPGNIPK